MVSTDLQARIGRFLLEVDEPYVLVEKVSSAGIRQIRSVYLQPVLALPETARADILSKLRISWLSNQDHMMVRRWGRAARGIAEFLLLPTNFDEVDIDPAADTIVRVSRWHYSEVNLWRRFVPYASFVVDRIWGEIENLHKLYSEE